MDGTRPQNNLKLRYFTGKFGTKSRPRTNNLLESKKGGVGGRSTHQLKNISKFYKTYML
jgi:hypothetical protein